MSDEGPRTSLVMDNSGNLYGANFGDGAYGWGQDSSCHSMAEFGTTPSFMSALAAPMGRIPMGRSQWTPGQITP